MDLTMDELFKFPQIMTRSKAKIHLKECNNELENIRNADFNINKISNSPEKRITRSMSTNKLTPRKKAVKKDVDCRSIHSTDSGYVTNFSSGSSVASRESGFSDVVRSIERLSTDESDLSAPAVSPSDSCKKNNELPFLPLKKLKISVLREGKVCALVPHRNINGYNGQFKLMIENNPALIRTTIESDFRVQQLSPVLSLKPHGIEFYDNEPAILIIPLRFEPRDETWLTVFCSNTSSSTEPNWQRIPRSDFYIRNGNVIVTLRHFSLFTIIEEEPFPEIMKKIRCRTGGRLRIPDVPGIEVNFPRGCLEHDINACLRVLFDKEPNLGGSPLKKKLPLASPIISLGPHGQKFNPKRLPVLITLPIPEYEEILRVCPTAKLVAYQSSTAEYGEPMIWQKVNIHISESQLIAYRHGISGVPIPSVTFPVYHFSFFKVVWELLSATLYEAKMGMSYFYPHVSFSMMCQAFMEESNENNRFGLEVICYRSDRKLPEATNYRHRVGASLKPKLVRPGKIAVRLRSQMFEADVEAGEDENMMKEEPDFRGRDFEKQYACRFKPDCCVERGPFGKVIVERITTRPDPLFEFNLHKTGIEASDNSPAMGCERWSVIAMKELAASLQITDSNNWKIFAKHIGFTKSEIKNKLNYSPDPFLSLMNMYNSRGGTPEEFIQALYVVSRDIRLGLNNGSNLSPSSGSSRSSRSNGSGSHGSGSQDSSPMKKIWGFRPWAQPVRDSDSTNSSKKDAPGSSNENRKRSLTDKKSGGSGSKKRKSSDGSERPASSSSDEQDLGEKEGTVSTEKHKNCSRKLNDKDLWRISSGIARKDWRNLGRTLGIEEIILGNLEHSHQSVGFRECAYQMLLEWKGRKPKKCTFGDLYSALLREKMNSVAKFMVRKIKTSAEENEDSDSD